MTEKKEKQRKSPTRSSLAQRKVVKPRKRKRTKKKSPDIICPRCGNPCDYIIKAPYSTRDGIRTADLCVHYYGRDENGNKVEVRHSLGPSSEKGTSTYKFIINSDTTDPSLLSRENIQLRSFHDKNRFIEYIEESLKLLKQQGNFNVSKVYEVLEVIKKWLQDLDSKEEYKKFIEEKINEIKQKISNI